MVSARSVVQLLAPVIKFLFFAGPGRTGAGRKVDARLYAHIAYRNTRSCERAWWKDCEGLLWPLCPSSAENG